MKDPLHEAVTSDDVKAGTPEWLVEQLTIVSAHAGAALANPMTEIPDHLFGNQKILTGEILRRIPVSTEEKPVESDTAAST